MPELLAEPEIPKSRKRTTPDGLMSLMEHLEELRRRVFKSALAVAIGVGIGWYKVEAVIGKMEAPVRRRSGPSF